jgi:hypothetical protein
LRSWQRRGGIEDQAEVKVPRDEFASLQVEFTIQKFQIEELKAEVKRLRALVPTEVSK